MFTGREEFWSVVLIVSVCLCFVSVSALLPPSQCVVTGSESVICTLSISLSSEQQISNQRVSGELNYSITN